MITSKNVQYCVKSAMKGEDILVLDHELNAKVTDFLQLDFNEALKYDNRVLVCIAAADILKSDAKSFKELARLLIEVQEFVSNLLIDTWNCKIECNTWPDIFDLLKVCNECFVSQVIDCLIQISQQQC